MPLLRNKKEIKKRLEEGGRAMRITMSIVAPTGATIYDVQNFLFDLEWSGGCRDPEDPMFESLLVKSSTVRIVK